MVNTKVRTRSNLWWNKQSSLSKIEKTIYTPFVIKFVDYTNKACSRCHWTKKCLGCVLEPNEESVYMTMVHNQYLVCEWDVAFLKENIVNDCYVATNHASVQSARVEMQREKNIEDCFNMFSKGD